MVTGIIYVLTLQQLTGKNMRSVLIAVFTIILTGCATDPKAVDPDVFRQNAVSTVVRAVNVSAETAAMNLNKSGVKCWESKSIRVKQYKELDRYVVTIGLYGDFTRSLLIMSDIDPKGENKSQVSVSISKIEHKRYAENLALWADLTSTECSPP